MSGWTRSSTLGNPLQSIGAYLQATAIGSLNGVPDQPSGVTRITQVGDGTYNITADFTLHRTA